MCKESMMANVCACGQRIQFMEQHIPHCVAAKNLLDLQFKRKAAR